jgi:hypothetical protein
MIPTLCATKRTVVASTSHPYSTLRLKLTEEASSKYFVGQEISPKLKPNMTAWAIIWSLKHDIRPSRIVMHLDDTIVRH